MCACQWKPMSVRIRGMSNRRWVSSVPEEGTRTWPRWPHPPQWAAGPRWWPRQSVWSTSPELEIKQHRVIPDQRPRPNQSGTRPPSHLGAVGCRSPQSCGGKKRKGQHQCCVSVGNKGPARAEIEEDLDTDRLKSTCSGWFTKIWNKEAIFVEVLLFYFFNCSMTKNKTNCFLYPMMKDFANNVVFNPRSHPFLSLV